MRLVVLAAGILAIAMSGTAFAAATYGGGRQTQDSGLTTARSGGSDGQFFQPQCYPTGITHVVRCSTPKLVPVSAGDSCYCSEVKVRTSQGIVRESRCSSEKIAGVCRRRCRSPSATDCAAGDRRPCEAPTADETQAARPKRRAVSAKRLRPDFGRYPDGTERGVSHPARARRP